MLSVPAGRGFQAYWLPAKTGQARDSRESPITEVTSESSERPEPGSSQPPGAATRPPNGASRLMVSAPSVRSSRLRIPTPRPPLISRLHCGYMFMPVVPVGNGWRACWLLARTGQAMDSREPPITEATSKSLERPAPGSSQPPEVATWLSNGTSRLMRPAPSTRS